MCNLTEIMDRWFYKKKTYVIGLYFKEGVGNFTQITLRSKQMEMELEHRLLRCFNHRYIDHIRVNDKCNKFELVVTDNVPLKVVKLFQLNELTPEKLNLILKDQLR